jgi:hypothetical protein
MRLGKYPPNTLGLLYTLYRKRRNSFDLFASPRTGCRRQLVLLDKKAYTRPLRRSRRSHKPSHKLHKNDDSLAGSRNFHRNLSNRFDTKVGSFHLNTLHRSHKPSHKPHNGRDLFGYPRIFRYNPSNPPDKKADTFRQNKPRRSRKSYHTNRNGDCLHPDPHTPPNNS